MGKTVHDTNAAIVATGNDYTTAVRLFWVAMVLAWAGIAWGGPSRMMALSDSSNTLLVLVVAVTVVIGLTVYVSGWFG